MAGHIDEGDLTPGGQDRPGESEIDGEPAAALLLPPVWLHPGQRANQRALAVIDVTGRRDDVRRHRSVRGPIISAASGLRRLAEADRNRTCQTEVLGLTGFEDREDHQEPKRLRTLSH